MRHMTTRRWKLAVCAVAAAIAFVPPAQACTGILLKATDGTVVRGRTMEFGVDTGSNVILVPRGYQRTGTAPEGKPGKSWTVKYASVGANALDLPLLVDGLNEKGLSIGLFYFPNTADYQPYQPDDAAKTIAPWELGSYILDNFATLDEVRAGVQDVVVPAVTFAKWNMVLPVHYVVTDPSGASLVVEYVDGELKLHDNPLGVLTNTPAFDWHIANLNNYMNLILPNVPPRKMAGMTFKGFGQGTGLLGLPGDFTPPSRFVRAAIFSQGVVPSADGSAAVLQLFHILNNFDIPRGVAREGEKDEHGNIVADYTQWASANDLAAKKFYFRTYDNSDIRVVDLTKQNLDADTIQTWSMAGTERFHEVGAPE